MNLETAVGHSALGYLALAANLVGRSLGMNPFIV